MSIPILDKPHNKQLIINNLKHYKIMKATNNNVDTLFMDIFVELFAIAKVYFQELFKNADPGTYTIKDIYAFIEKNIEATKEGKLTGVNPYFSDRYKKTLEKSPYYTKVNSFEKYTISYLCRVTDNIVSIEKENFKCSFDIIKVFEYLERFKKLSGAKDKLEFTKETEIKEGQKSTSFEIELSKEDIKFLISVKTEKKDIMNRYIENTAHLSLTDSTIYATNCFVLKAKRVDAKNVLGEIKDILIPFGVLKNIGAGNCNFTVTEGEKTYNVVVKNTTTDKVVSYSFEKIEKFIDYKFVYPELYKEMNICLKDTKLFVNRIKTQQKAYNRLGLSYFLIQVIKGLKEIKVVTCNEAYNIDNDYKFSEFSFELKESSEFSGNYFYRFDTVLKCLDDWNGNLYFDEIKLSFGTKAVDACFCVGTYDTNKSFDKYSVVESKPDKLTKIKTISTSAILDNCDNQSKNNLDTKNFRVVCGECFEPVCKNELYYNVLLETENNRMTIRTVVGKDIDVKIIGNSIEETVNANINKIEDELYKFCIRKMSKYYKVGIKQDGVVIFTLDGKHRHEYRNICEAYLSLIEPSLSKTYKNHLDAIYKETPKEGDYVEFNLSCNADAPIYTGLILNDPGLGLVCIVDGQKIEVREMINLKVLKQEESKTVSPTQSGEESALNDKERSKAKETKPIMQYTDDMLELVSLDLNSMTYVVNGDIGTAKNIQSIVLYDEIGKIVVSCDDGKKIECQFDGESILQSVLKEM